MLPGQGADLVPQSSEQGKCFIAEMIGSQILTMPYGSAPPGFVLV